MESCCLCFSRLVENFQTDQRILKEIAVQGLLTNIQQLVRVPIKMIYCIDPKFIGQTGQGKHCKPRSLIRVFTVCCTLASFGGTTPS